jgi:hypothetical protein
VTDRDRDERLADIVLRRRPGSAEDAAIISKARQMNPVLVGSGQRAAIAWLNRMDDERIMEESRALAVRRIEAIACGVPLEDAHETPLPLRP